MHKFPLDQLSHGKWVSSLTDDRAGIISTSSCVALSMLNDDGEVKLVVAHAATKFDTSLKVFRGTTLISESRLADLPVAIAPFQNEENSSPAIAVASGPSILCYKNLRPFYKYTPKGTKLHPIEYEAWSKAEQSELTAEDLHTVLENLSKEIPLNQLSQLSQTLLTLPKEEWTDFVESFGQKDFRNLPPLTCMATMKKSTAETVDFLAIGSESGEISIVDGQAFLQRESVMLPSVATGIVTHGVYDVDFRLFVSTRSSQIFSVKRGAKSVERPIISTTSPIVAFTKLNKMLVVACADSTLAFYSFRGKRLNMIKMEEPVIALEPFFYAPKQTSAVLVLLSKEVRMYNEQFLMDVVKVNRHLKWLRYGPFGREDAALILGTREGGLIVKLLRRKANFDDRINIDQHIQAHTLKLNIPKKTKAFVDQTVREKEQTAIMNQAYQKDLFLLRYKTTQAFAQMSSSASAAVATDKQVEVDISVEIHGFGPTFRITIRLNSSAQSPLFGMWLSLLGSKDLYRFDSNLIPVSSIFPGHFYTYTTLLHCLAPENAVAGDIRVLLVRPGRQIPIVSAVVAMPLSEMSLLD